MAPFHEWGSIASRLEPLRRGSLLIFHFWYSFYRPRKDERLGRRCSHPVVKFQVIFLKIWTLTNQNQKVSVFEVLTPLKGTFFRVHWTILPVGPTFLKIVIRCHESFPRSKTALYWWIGINNFKTSFDILVQFCILFCFFTPKLFFARPTENLSKKVFWKTSRPFVNFKIQLNHQYLSLYSSWSLEKRIFNYPNYPRWS